MQAKFWGQNARDWATLQEPTGNAGYEYALKFIQLKPSDKLLDIGCGTGYFADLAAQTGAEITGIDATATFIEKAKSRNPSVNFMTGEMEELPFADNIFDVVTGFNSLQYAANVKNALLEAKRVLKEKGKLVVMIWGEKENCEAATYLKVLASFMPVPPPGAPGPYALTENHLLEKLLTETGMKILYSTDVDSIWEYPDMATALKGLLSAGPSAKAIEHSGLETVSNATAESLKPFLRNDGSVVIKNKFRVVISEK